MPKKCSVYTRNKDFIDGLRQQGKSWEDVSLALGEIGVKITRAGVHSAYQAYLCGKKAASVNSSAKAETEPPPKQPVLKRAKEEAEAARVAGNLNISGADQVRQWAVNLNYYSTLLAHDYLDVCKGKDFETCLREFQKRMNMLKEIARNMR